MSDEGTPTTTSDAVDAAPTTPASTPTPASPSTPPPAEHAPSQAQPSSTGETHQTLLEAVQSAVPELQKTDQQESDGQGASPAPSATTDPASPDVDDDGELPDEVTSEEMAKYALSAKRRIRKLMKQRHEARAEASRLKAIEPQAQTAEHVSTFLRDNNISRDDFLLGLKLMGAISTGDFATARAGLEPYWNLIEQFHGNQLPPDLLNAVRQGQMTTEAAVQFSKERLQRAMLEQRHQRTQQVAEQQQKHFQTQQEEQQRQVLANNVANHVNAWERAAMQHDPAYAEKQAAVRNTMWAVVRETGGTIRSPEHAVGVVREAYRRVNEQYRSWTPPKRSTSRSPSSTGRTTGAAPEAKSLLDVVRQARENARAS